MRITVPGLPGLNKLLAPQCDPFAAMSRLGLQMASIDEQPT